MLSTCIKSVCSNLKYFSEYQLKSFNFEWSTGNNANWLILDTPSNKIKIESYTIECIIKMKKSSLFKKRDVMAT